MHEDTAKMIIEHFDDKFSVMLENVETVIETKVRGIVQEELEPIKTDLKIIKAAVRETNKDFQDLKVRVAVLEAA